MWVVRLFEFEHTALVYLESKYEYEPRVKFDSNTLLRTALFQLTANQVHALVVVELRDHLSL